jgi:BirA family biotin operon repressor/biotin-[acetyl-CoA-carboxylase] ligase
MPHEAPPLTLAAGLGVYDAIAAAGARPMLKWPNDVLVDGRKLAGVLTEMNTQGARLAHVIVGIGVNLRSRVFPESLADTATSLAQAGVEVEWAWFVATLCEHLERWFDAFADHGARALTRAWMERARGDGTLERPVRTRLAHGVVEGHITGLNEDGHLLVTDADGRVHVIAAGVVEYV